MSEPTIDTIDTLALPTVGRGATLAQVAADPVGVNTEFGHFTTSTKTSGQRGNGATSAAGAPSELPFRIGGRLGADPCGPSHAHSRQRRAMIVPVARRRTHLRPQEMPRVGS
jgi:hypothetical protein